MQGMVKPSRAAEEEKRVDVIEMEIMSDHVHLLYEIHPQCGVHHFVKLIKGRSSRLLRQEFPNLKSRLPTLWTNAYFISTVGGVPLEVIKQTIENQKKVCDGLSFNCNKLHCARLAAARLVPSAGSCLPFCARRSGALLDGYALCAHPEPGWEMA